jgi:endogenous inhibitor of DNA gyrase (YacG/DUF329 family)
MNLLKCKRCGADIASGPRDTNRTFCGADCRDSWWNEFRTKGVTRGDDQRKRILWSGNKTPVHLTETQAIWLAAMVDGEGTVSIYRERRPKNSSGFRYKAVVGVTNTNRAIIDRATELMQGYASVKDKRPDHHKTCYIAYAHGRNVEAIARAIRPHLVAKNRQVDLVLEFCEVMKSAPWRTSRVHEILERLWAEIRILNRRGQEVLNGW